MYIETRKTWIKAIRKSIEEKWVPICEGLTTEPNCELCEVAEVYADRYNGGECKYCPLAKRYGESCLCVEIYEKWDAAASVIDCDECPSEPSNCSTRCPRKPAPKEAMDMLNALIMLLPPEERKRYEPDE